MVSKSDLDGIKASIAGYAAREEIARKARWNKQRTPTWLILSAAVFTGLLLWGLNEVQTEKNDWAQLKAHPHVVCRIDGRSRWDDMGQMTQQEWRAGLSGPNMTMTNFVYRMKEGDVCRVKWMVDEP